MKPNSLTLCALLFFVITLSSCSSTTRLPEVAGYRMFTIPSSNYKTGYLVAIWKNPPKEDIIFRPWLSPDVLIKSASINLSMRSINSTSADIKANLEKVGEGKLAAGFTEALIFNYTNTRVIDADHTRLFRDLTTSLERASPQEKSFLRQLTQRSHFGLMPPRAKLDVLTGVLIADVEFEIDQTSDAGAKISTNELIDLLGADFRTTGGAQSKIIGRNVVIGYRADPHMADILNQWIHTKI